MSYQQRRQYLTTDQRGTERAKWINARHGINHLPAETMQQSAPRNSWQTCTKEFEEAQVLTSDRLTLALTRFPDDGSANFCIFVTLQRKTHFTFHRRNVHRRNVSAELSHSGLQWPTVVVRTTNHLYTSYTVNCQKECSYRSRLGQREMLSMTKKGSEKTERRVLLRHK